MSALSSHGYVLIWIKEKGKYVYEHSYLIEQILGKPISKGWIVHHKDLNRSNNTLSNLILCNNVSTHKWLHHQERAELECGDVNKAWCSKCKSWLDIDKMVAKRKVGHCKICHATSNRGRLRDYKKEWQQRKIRELL
jgi:hypothetical protein